VHGNYYGTSAEFIDRQRAKGRHVLLDIDVQGAAQIRKRYPGSITIFIMPPSMDALKQRLTARDTDTPATVAKRLRNAGREMDRSREYQHVVINDQLEQAVQELISIVEAHRQEA
jgi:guanylate kinase